MKVQLFEKLIEYPEAERLVFESTPRLPVEETPLGEALGLALARGPHGHDRLAALR